MKPLLLGLSLTATSLCLGNESGPPAWSRAFFTDRFEVSLPAPADPGLTLRWSADGLVPRASAQPWTGPVSFRESAAFCARVFRGRESSGGTISLSLVQTAAATPAQAVETGLWTRAGESPWVSLSAPVSLPPGALATGVLRVPQAGLVSLAWSDTFVRVDLGTFSFTPAEAAQAPFWIEAGDYPLTAETRADASRPTALEFKAVEAKTPLEFRRPAQAPVPFASWTPAAAGVERTLDGREETVWTVPSAGAEASWTLALPSEAKGGALLVVTDPGLTALPGRFQRTNGHPATAVPIAPGRFHLALTADATSLTLVQPANAASWTVREIHPLPPDLRPLASLAVNPLSGDDASALPGLQKLAGLTLDLWPRVAAAARMDPRLAPRQLWVGCLGAAKGEPVKLLGRHLLCTRETLESPETPGRLLNKLGELASRASAKSPADVCQGLGAGIASLVSGAEGTPRPPAPEGSRALLISGAAREHPEAFFKLLADVRTGWDVSMWKEFEGAALNRKPTEK